MSDNKEDSDISGAKDQPDIQQIIMKMKAEATNTTATTVENLRTQIGIWADEIDAANKNIEEKENGKNSPFTNMIRNVLNCLPSKKDAMHDFYVKKIGMKQVEATDNKIIYGFAHNDNKRDSFLELRYNKEFKQYDSDQVDAYWKIGIASPDVDTTRNSLIANNITVSAPAQFQDIGYLCHLSDPHGYGLELLQHTFSSNFDSKKIKDIMDTKKYILGSKEVSVGQITLRVSNMKESLIFYEKVMGMKYLSKQTVNKYGFTLYFLGYPDNDEIMPKSDDVEAVENREWLWQRPYTTLELQHKWKSGNDNKYKIPKQNETGWQGIVFQSKLNAQNTQKYLKQFNVNVDVKDNQYVLKCCDPDGYTVFIQCEKD